MLSSLPRGPSLRFEAGRVSGFAGCNNLMGSYSLAGDMLTLGQLAGSMMACPGEAMTLERSFHAALAGTHRVAVTGDRLTLTAESGKVMSFQAEAPPALAGGTWTVTGYNNGRQAVVSPAPGTELSLAFAEDGSLSGNAGCNSFRASYTVDGDRMTVGPAATTRKFCGPEVMDQERAFLAALGSVTRWTIDGGMLDAHRADGERALTATRHTE
jgi:heat shock protein HslJ